jgi:hypothetical protein
MIVPPPPSTHARWRTRQVRDRTEARHHLARDVRADLGVGDRITRDIRQTWTPHLHQRVARPLVRLRTGASARDRRVGPVHCVVESAGRRSGSAARVPGSMRAARNTHPGELRGFARARGSIQFGQPPQSTMTVRRRPATLGLTTTRSQRDLLDEGGAPEPTDHAVIDAQCHRLIHATPRRFGSAPLVI